MHVSFFKMIIFVDAVWWLGLGIHLESRGWCFAVEVALTRSMLRVFLLAQFRSHRKTPRLFSYWTSVIWQEFIIDMHDFGY